MPVTKELRIARARGCPLLREELGPKGRAAEDGAVEGWERGRDRREVRWGGCCDTGEIARGVSLQGRHLEGAA